MKLEADIGLKSNLSAAPVQKIEKAEQPESVKPFVKTEKKEEDQQEVTKNYLEEKINDTNNFLEPNFTSVKFKLHEDLNRYYVEVIDSDSKEVVREIPAKEFLDMIAKMTDFLGVLIDKKI
ncbi:flagellar protein FlaG [Cytobacillus gottheilii]|uniref:Flagellar protein FlaG n=1 Tax=Cytobacillus gottheilii TaxID=859144 RepID=A0ABX8FAT5_9BACI|nr:flagellar protein FlaG [Cytobacillus gottheilii]QVY61210.1 flagellar protein FlaG [Cytobacillus gottheilii]